MGRIGHSDRVHIPPTIDALHNVQSTAPADNEAIAYDSASGLYKNQTLNEMNGVTASSVIADNALVRGDGGARGVQGSGILISDSDTLNMGGGQLHAVGHIRLAAGSQIQDAAGREYLEFGSNGGGAPVNQIKIFNSQTGNSVQVKSEGGDTNVDLELLCEGTGDVIFHGNTSKIDPSGYFHAERFVFFGDTNTYIDSSGADSIAIVAGGVAFIKIFWHTNPAVPRYVWFNRGGTSGDIDVLMDDEDGNTLFQMVGETGNGVLKLGTAALQWPNADGTANQVLKTDGSGALGWVTASGAAHAMLDGSVHNDSVADTVKRGSLIYGNATPKWDELVVGNSGEVLTSDGTDVAWAAPSGGAFDSTAVDATTWSDGVPASNLWTFNLSGTDTTMLFGSAKVTFSHAVTVTGAIIGSSTLAVTGVATFSNDVTVAEDVNLVQGKRMNLEGAAGDTYLSYDGTSIVLTVNGFIAQRWST